MEMLRKDRMLNQGETIDILNRSEYGILSTVGKDNAPYGVPLNFAYVEGVIYFHCAKANGYKIIKDKNAPIRAIHKKYVNTKTKRYVYEKIDI